MTNSPDQIEHEDAFPVEEIEEIDLLNPYEVLKGFRLPNFIERNGDRHYYPRVLPESGAIAVIGEAGTETAGRTLVFLARECFIEGRPLLVVAREAFNLKHKITDCCHSPI